MPKSKYLLIGSTEAYSGKSATALGIAHQLKERGLDIAYGKPLGTFYTSVGESEEEDVQFVAQTLGLPASRVLPPHIAINRFYDSKADSRREHHQLSHYADPIFADAGG